MADEVAEEISAHFLIRDHQWRFDDEYRVPSSEEVQHNLDKAVERLYAEKEGTSLQVGGLIIHKSEGHYDVYVHIGEINDKDS